MPRLVASLAVLCLAACATSRTEGSGGGASVAPKQACVRVFQKQRACTDSFIPALVDLRISLDVPAGIAAEGKAPGGRDALIAKALEEWKGDSTDAAIDKTCEKMAASPKFAPNAAAADACASMSACGPFVDCVIPLMRKQMARSAP